MLDPIRNEALHPEELIMRLQLPPDAVVADIGAGPGFFALPLARAVPKGRVIAADIRDDYLAVTMARTRRAGVANVSTRKFEPARPGLKPRSIDVAFLCQVDQYFPERVSYLTALLPALRRGGRVVLVNYERYREANLAAATKAGLRTVDEWAPSPGFFVLVLALESI
jgi:ubiquinone/menaquinone biosynthesis C-methylase UbiE